MVRKLQAIYDVYTCFKHSTYATCYCIQFVQTLLTLVENLSGSLDQDHLHATYACHFHQINILKFL